jgi:hypothetical protein
MYVRSDPFQPDIAWSLEAVMMIWGSPTCYEMKSRQRRRPRIGDDRLCLHQDGIFSLGRIPSMRSLYDRLSQ